ncbi:tail assembly protein [Thorsellia anophelis]|uniref:Phage-related protein, tail component n=1 Tax=Thorsellia anophelis DSM 18579 TaxID=1123402 RepID=A0A1I0D5Y7_9GAMM|nr:tail assembly protein [Thorsellia anophelis]SET27677.1 Phage-related protein, tail component [Thorsellia anophelis DSM 18579]
MARLTKIRLGGVLGRKFGKIFELDISTTAEAIRALSTQIQGFDKFLLDSKKMGLTFAVFKSKRNIGIDEMHDNVGQNEIRIVPVVIGNKSGGLFQTILGVALLGVAAIMTGGTVLGAAGMFAAGTTAGTFGLMGAAMLLGGIVQMLSPQPKGLGISESPENKPNYAFGGSVNTTAQGNPVAVYYGHREIGGAIISAGIYTDDQQ